MNNNKEYKKVLFVFDLDNTLTLTGGDFSTFELLKVKDKGKELLSLWPKLSWCDIINLLMKEFKKQNTTIEEIKYQIQRNLLNPGMFELLSYIKENKEKADIILVSGSNIISIEWQLQSFKLDDGFFKKIFANPSSISLENLIEVGSYSLNDCSNSNCEKDMCKKLIVEDYLNACSQNGQNYLKTIYVGDGTNDYCPGTILTKSDILFPRHNFPLFKMLFESEQPNSLLCEIVPWNDGFQILNYIKSNKLI